MAPHPPPLRMRSIFLLLGSHVVGGIDTDAEESDISLRRSIPPYKLACFGAPVRAFHLLLLLCAALLGDGTEKRDSSRE